MGTAHDKQLVAKLSKLPQEELAKMLAAIAADATSTLEKNFLHYASQPDNTTLDAMAPRSVPTIVEDHDLSLRRDGEATHRLLIGDNIHALTGLLIKETGSYDGIYIDPPYNTGRQFTYNDKHLSDDDAWSHTKWLSVIEPRLRLAHRLLSETGVIFVAIGDHEHHRLRLMMDSIFGEENFLANIIWEGGARKEQFVSSGVDYMLVYAKSKTALNENKVVWTSRKPNYDLIQSKVAELFAKHDGDAEAATKEFRVWQRSAGIVKGDKMYNTIDETGRLYRLDNLSKPQETLGSVYDLMHPVTGHPCKMPPKGWVFILSTMEAKMAEGLIIFGKDHTTVPQLKRYYDEMSNQTPRSVINVERSGGRNRLEDIVGKNAFDYPKDPEVLARWFHMAFPSDAKVLDFYAGSGTTAEAVLSLNAADGGTRTVTLVTNDENGIGTNVTRERVVRVMTGENWAKPHRAQALGGSLAVYRVGMRDLGEDFRPNYLGSDEAWSSWNRDAFLWSIIGTHPWVTLDDDGLLVVSDDEGNALSCRYDIFSGYSEEGHWCHDHMGTEPDPVDPGKPSVPASQLASVARTKRVLSSRQRRNWLAEVTAAADTVGA